MTPVIGIFVNPDVEDELCFRSSPPVVSGIHLYEMTKVPCVYILAGQPHGTLYIGVTSHLIKRCWEHQHGFIEGFTNTYNVHRLVYYELHQDMTLAITREKTTQEVESRLEACID